MKYPIYKFSRNHFSLEIDIFQEKIKKPPKAEDVAIAIIAKYPWVDRATLPTQHKINLDFEITKNLNMFKIRMSFPWGSHKSGRTTAY